MILKKLHQTKILLLDSLAYMKLQLYTPAKNQKSLLVNFENPQLYHRFFYLVLKFYKLSGYTIYFPMSFSMFRNLRNKDRYLGLIMREEDFLTINKKNLPKDYIEITDSMFSPDYFNSYFRQNNQESKAFHIPMSFHPLMYHQNIWDHEINIDKKRLNSLFAMEILIPRPIWKYKELNLKLSQGQSFYIFLKTKGSLYPSIKKKK